VTTPDPRVVALRIRDETGVDLLDPGAEASAASVAMRRSLRQVAGTIGCGLLGAVALFCFAAVFAPSGPDGGGRAAVAVVGVACLLGALTVVIWGWRMPRAYREVFLPRRAAQQRFFTELGQEWPNALSATDWLGRKAVVAYSAPSQVRELREAQRQHPPAQSRDDDPPARRPEGGTGA
jgi:hypothetical protein